MSLEGKSNPRRVPTQDVAYGEAIGRFAPEFCTAWDSAGSEVIERSES